MTSDNEPRGQLKRRWEALLDVSPDLVFWLSHDGTYLGFHATQPEHLITSPEMFLGKNLVDVMPPEQGLQALAAVQRTIATGAVESIEYSIELHGTMHRFEARMLAAGQEVVALVRDITSLAEAQQETAQVTKYFEALVNDSFELIVVTNESGVVEYVSAAASLALGYQPEALIGTSFHQYVHADDLAIALEALGILKQKELGKGPVEVRIIDERGGWRTCEVNAANLLDDPAVNALVFHLRDVTQRLVAQRRFRFLFETHPMPSAYLPPNSGAIIANGAFSQLFGYASPQDIAQIGPAQLLAASDRDATIHNLLNGLENDQQFRGEIVALRKDGTPFPAQLWASVATETEDSGAILIAIDDLSEVRAAQAQVAAQEVELEATRAQRDSAELEARLRKAQRLESVGRLAAGVAHDFTNLVGVALNYASAIERSELNEEQREDLEQIQMSVQLAADLAQRLLQFGRADSTATGTFDFAEHLRAMHPVLHNIAGRGIKLVVESTDTTLVVAANSAQMDRVIMNLVMNARDAVADAGSIRIVLDTVEHPLPSIRLQVIDNGCGMPDSVIDNAFDPFFSTKPQGMGTGLGLAVVDGVVGAAGGSVLIDSVVGVGTTVTVLLPHACRAASIES